MEIWGKFGNSEKKLGKNWKFGNHYETMKKNWKFGEKNWKFEKKLKIRKLDIDNWIIDIT